MVVNIYILILIPIIIYSIYKERNIYNPSTIFAGIWLFIAILSSFRLYGLNKTSSRAYLFALIGVFSFCLGCLVRSRYRIKTKRIRGFNSVDDYKIKYWFLILLYALANVFTLIMARRSFSLIASGIPMSVIRNNYRNIEAGLIVDSSFTYYVEQYFIAAAEFAAIALFPIVLFDKKSFRKLLLLMELIAFLILHIFVTGARSFMIDLLITLMIYALINHQYIKRFREYFNKIPKVLIVLIAAGAIALIITMSRLRKGGDVLFGREIYMYFSISFPLFDTHLSLMNSNPTFTYGMTLLNGLLRPFLLILRHLGFSYPRLYRTASQILSDNNLYYSVGQTRANSFVTAFFNFYTDFGLIGIVFGCFMWGYVSQSFYQSMKNNPNRRSQALYLLLAVGLFLSFARFLFAAYRYLYSFFIILLAFTTKAYAGNNKTGIKFTIRSKKLR